MGADEAQKITERIRITATNARESLTKLQELVEEAQRGQAHVALGYKSWQAYIADVFGDEPMQLRAPEERREIVQWLTAEGMSPNAIAPVVGVTRQRVSQIRAEIQGASDLHPERGPLTLAPEEAEGHAESVNRGISYVQRMREERPTITGLDGKTYTRPEPHAARPIRRPLPDMIADALHELDKRADVLAALIQDDRFRANRETVAARSLAQAKKTANTLAGVLAAMQTNSQKV